MNPEYPFVKPRRHPNSFVLTVSLRGAPSRRQRRAFFSRLYRQARGLGLVFAQKLGLCVFYNAERICGSAHRHQIVAWLTDQREVAGVAVCHLEHLADLWQQPERLPTPDIRRMTQTPFEDQLLWRRVVTGVIKQWVCYVTERVE